MSATFNPSLGEPRDRIRRDTGDVAARFRFEDETIAAVLAPFVTIYGAGRRAELHAAIDLLENAPPRREVSSLRQGSTGRTFATTGESDADRLARLRGLLAAWDLPVGGSSIIAVVDVEAPRTEAYEDAWSGAPGHDRSVAL